MEKPKLESSRQEHRGRVVTVCTEQLRYGDGRLHDIDMIHHPGAAAMVAIDERGRVCLVKQYRHGIEDFLWEIPAGKLDRGEQPEATAARELTEETGLIASQWDSLGAFLPAPGLMTEIVHLYLARDLKTGAAAPDADEELEICWMPLSEAIDRVLDGTFSDGKTGVALVRAQYRLRPPKA